MKHWLILCAIIMAGLCLGQTYTLEIRARIDGEPGYCDSLLSLAGASPGAGIHDIPAGDSVTMTIDTTLVEVAIGTRDSCYGWTSIASTLDSTHGYGTSLSFVMSDNVSVVWNFKRQFTFEVTCSHDYDSPNPPYGVHWFDGGDSITASIDMWVRDTFCLGYIGTGSVDTGPSNSWTGILEEPSSIQWIIDVVHPVCSLLVISEHGECLPPADGTWNYFIHNSTFDIYTSAIDSSDSSLGYLYECIGWSGAGCIPESGPVPYVRPFHICTVVCSSTFGTIEWLWDTLFTGIEENSTQKPDDIALSAQPNPFNSSITIILDYGSESPQALSTIEIFDINGRMVAKIPASNPVGEGLRPSRSSQTTNTGGSKTTPLRNEYRWQPDENIFSGVYLVRATVGPSTGSGTETKSTKIIYLK